MPKISILILLLELYLHFFSSNFNLITTVNHIYPINEISITNIFSNEGIYLFTEIKNLLLISSLLSLIIGTIVGLAQTRIKRLLAYSEKNCELNYQTPGTS
jgi:NADH-ubiquinone oxidoreductase chain 2